MNSGMRPSVFITRIRHMKKRQLNCILNQNGYVMISKRFLKKFGDAENILTL